MPNNPLTGLSTFGNLTLANTGNLDSNYNSITAFLNTLANYGNYFVDAGAANAIQVNVNANLTVGYVAGLPLQVRIAATNTGATTLQVNALGTRSVVNVDGTALVAGELVTNGVYSLIYDAISNVFVVQGSNSGTISSFVKLTVGPPPAGNNALIVNGVSGTTGLYVTAGGAADLSASFVGNGISITQPAAATGANLNLTGGPSGSTINRIRYNSNSAANNSFAIRDDAASIDRMSCNANGQWTIAAPSAGQDPVLTVSGTTNSPIVLLAATSDIYTLQLSGTSGNRAGITMCANGAAIGTNDFVVYQTSTNIAQLINRASASLVLGTSGNAAITINSGGGVTISTPTAGNNSLTMTAQTSANCIRLNTVDASAAINVVGSAGVQTSFVSFNQTGQAQWQIYQPASSNDFRIYGNGADRLQIQGNGNFIMLVPSAGATLDASNTANSAYSLFPLRFAIGHAGGDYPIIGYNFLPTTTSGVYNYNTTAVTSAIQFQNGGFNFLQAPSGTAGNPITFTTSLSIASTGAVTINAPSSGSTALTVNAGATVHQSLGLLIKAGTASDDWALNIQSNGGTQLGLFSGTGGIQLGYNGSSPTIVGTVNGAVTINTPVSGNTPLTVNGINAQNVVVVTDGTVTSMWQTNNVPANQIRFGTTTNHQVLLVANNSPAIGINPGTGGQVATSFSGDITGRGIALIARATADQAVTSQTALQDSTYVTMALVTGTYRIRALILMYQSAAGNAGIKVGFYSTVSLTAAQSQMSWSGYVAGGAVAVGQAATVQTSATAMYTSAAAALTTTTPRDYLEFNGILTLTGNGTFKLCFAQQTSTAINTYIAAGSFMEAVQLS
jgi:hypothetical protein